MSSYDKQFWGAWLTVMLLFLAVFGLMIGAWKAGIAHTVITPQPQTPTDTIGPDISWCHTQDVYTLWDCIRNAEYAWQEENSE